MKTQLTILDNGSRTFAMTKPVSGRNSVLALLMRLLWAAVLVLPVFGAQAGAVVTTLHSFQVFPNGEHPSGLVQGSDGNFYGTTENGGATNYDAQTYNFGYGTVFKISTNGVQTSLYSFTGGTDGANPSAGLVQGSDGNLYGTTQYGGTNDYGTVFKISTNGVQTSLYSFTGGTDGANPSAGLVQGSDGYLYGTTAQAGTNGGGTVFKISTNGALTSLYSFALLWDTNGLFMGSAGPATALVQGSDGNFYGTTSSGGVYMNQYGDGYGTVFKITTNGMLTSLYSFGSVQDTNGVPLDGRNPSAGLVQGSDGNFYGTTAQVGTNGAGTVFKISPTGALTSLYSFTGGNDGGWPSAALVQGSDGNFYGTTDSGSFIQGPGTVFKISPTGALTSLYSFTGGNDCAYPCAALVQGSDGYFYGTTPVSGYRRGRGAYYVGAGTVFKISPNGAYTSLYSFTGGNDGGSPNGLVQGSDGNLYGTTQYGGTNDYGTVFKISPNGALTTLRRFVGNDGANPSAGLVQGSDGYLYGTTGGTTYDISSPFLYGSVFKISTNGVLTSLHSFTGGNDGGWPVAALVQGSDGDFYGTTTSGGNIPSGTYGEGTVFKISPTGALTTLYSFTGLNDGWGPYALVRSSDGNFYGRTWGDRTSGSDGTVFKISTSGAYTTLYSFTGGNDGGQPYAAPVQGKDGDFYGTTSSGGAGGVGTVFRLTIVPEPQLTIIPSEPYVILTWPTDYNGFSYAGYTLQTATNLGSSAVWSTNSSPPVVIGGENVVINTTSGTRKFFRLSQ